MIKNLTYFLASTVAVIMFLGFSIGVVQAGPCELPDFASATFSNPTFIDNPYFTLIPGTIFRYEPVPNDDNVVNTVIITNRTKKITVGRKRIKCLEVHDFETVDGSSLKILLTGTRRTMMAMSGTAEKPRHYTCPMAEQTQRVLGRQDTMLRI
jgi:hypothetical protein